MLIDEEVYLVYEEEDFFEHHGIKGQKWGIRKQRRMENLRRVGQGDASTTQKLRAAYDTGPIDLVKGRGFKGGAARRSARQKKAFDNIGTGKTTARNILTRVAAHRVQDLIPTSKSKTNTKAAVGATMAGLVLAKVGHHVVKRAIRSAMK